MSSPFSFDADDLRAGFRLDSAFDHKHYLGQVQIVLGSYCT
jgi:hypothetical protein